MLSLQYDARGTRSWQRSKHRMWSQGVQLVGLTTELSEGGCGMATRKRPFSEGTQILLEITKNGVSLLTNATVIYNLKDQFMGIRFEEMPPEHADTLPGWIKAATA